MAWLGSARRGKAGMAGHGRARRGKAGMARLGSARLGKAWLGSARLGMAGEAWLGEAGHGKAGQGTAGPGEAWFFASIPRRWSRASRRNRKEAGRQTMFVALWWISMWDFDNERPADRCAMKWIGCFADRPTADAYIMQRHPWLLHDYGPGHLVITANTGQVWHGGELMRQPCECSARRLRELVEME